MTTTTLKLDSASLLGTEQETELRLAERFAASYADVIKFDHRRGAWRCFEPPVWRVDRDGAVVRHTIEFIKDLQADALEIPDQKRKEEVLNRLLRVESKSKIEQVIGLAKNLT